MSACPIKYRTAARWAKLGKASNPQKLKTIFAAGGLYGNLHALASILGMVEKEAKIYGQDSVRVVFNGDFNFFNATPELWREVNETIRHHPLCLVTLGNCELEAADPTPGMGCGCGYPPYVDPLVGVRAEAIVDRLRTAASASPEISAWLKEQPTIRLFELEGGARIGVCHGDPDVLSGWSLGVEQQDPPDPDVRSLVCSPAYSEPDVPTTTPERIAGWFESARVDAIACIHTCLPFIQAHPRGVIANNGSAGMPNFEGRVGGGGLVTRISEAPSRDETALYGTVGPSGVCVEALPVEYDQAAWRRDFSRVWPGGTPGHQSYSSRIRNGPKGFYPRNAARVGCTDVDADERQEPTPRLLRREVSFYSYG